MSQIGIPWKAIFAFIGVFAGQLLARTTVDGIPVFPHDANGWIGLIGGSLVAAAAVYFKQNVYTVEQAENHLAAAQERASKHEA